MPLTRPPRRREAPDAPGDFYVEDQCCLSCGMPMESAPELFDWLPNDRDGCYVKRQPANPAELTSMILAMHTAELDCIRYAGTDPAIQRRVRRAAADVVDSPLDLPLDVPVYTRLTLRPVAGLTARDLISAFREQMRLENARYDHLREAHTLIGDRSRSLRFAWYENHYHRVVAFDRAEEAGRILLEMSACEPGSVIGLTLHIERWIKADGRFTDLRWWTEQTWRARTGWAEEPI